MTVNGNAQGQPCVCLCLCMDLHTHAADISQFTVRSFGFLLKPTQAIHSAAAESEVAVSFYKQGSVRVKWKCIASIINKALHSHQQSLFFFFLRVNVCRHWVCNLVKKEVD